MIRTIITPDKESILLTIPKKYVGKQIEVLVYSSDEARESSPEGSATIASLKGKLSLDAAGLKAFLKHVDDTRDGWDRDF